MAELRKGTWSGSGWREQEERCRELGAVTVVRTPRAVGSSALCPLGNEDATFAADGVEAIFREGTPNRDANLLA